MIKFFSQPSKHIAILISILAGVLALATLLFETSLFTQKFDPGPLAGILLVVALWLVVRVWLNYNDSVRK